MARAIGVRVRGTVVPVLVSDGFEGGSSARLRPRIPQALECGPNRRLDGPIRTSPGADLPQSRPNDGAACGSAATECRAGRVMLRHSGRCSRSLRLPRHPVLCGMRHAQEVTDWGVGRYERTAEMLLPAARVLVDSASVKTAERVLDLGCGTGNVALLAAAAGAQVTAVDPSPRLLSVASATAERQGLALSTALGDAASIPASGSTFDCILSNFGLIFAPDPHAAAAEVARVATEDGRVAFTAWVPGGALGALASTAEALVRSAVGAPPATPGFPWHDEEELQAVFSRHGMTIAVRGPHELLVSAPSAEAYLEVELANHPLAVAADGVLRARGVAEEARENMLRVLKDHNEAEDAFRSTSRYIVVVATRG